MRELNSEQIIKSLECCGSKGSPKCADCPMGEKRGCAIELYRIACAGIKQIEADTIKKMQSMIKEECLAGGIYPAFVAKVVENVGKKLLEDVK